MYTLLESPYADHSEAPILIVEDSDEDFQAFLRAIRDLPELEKLPHPLLRFENGDEVLDYLFKTGEYEDFQGLLPAIMLLDLNLPGTDGREIIKQVKATPDLMRLPIVVLTTSKSPYDIRDCYGYGANSYMLKPMGVAALRAQMQTLLDYWFFSSVLPHHYAHQV